MASDFGCVKQVTHVRFINNFKILQIYKLPCLSVCVLHYVGTYKLTIERISVDNSLIYYNRRFRESLKAPV